jgi:hypothetical protein
MTSQTVKQIAAKIDAMRSVGAHDSAEYVEIVLEQLRKIAIRRGSPAQVNTFIDNIKKN